MNFLEKALNFIFPPICGMCKKNGQGYLCIKCKNKIMNSNIFLNQLDFYKNSFIEEHFYLFLYTGIMREKILQYKFKEQTYLANMILEFCIKNEKLYRFFKKYDIICSVPISKSRKRKRGYNQSELIAKKISKITLLHFEKNIIMKVKNNTPQSKLNKKQRQENVKNVYKIQNQQKIKNKNILLFDDIYTTGATVNECAKVLKNAGCKNVGVLTIAKDFKKV